MRGRERDSLFAGFLAIAVPLAIVVWLVDWFGSLDAAWQWLIVVGAVAAVTAAVWGVVISRRRSRAEYERWRAAALARQRELDRHLAYADGLSGREFEHLVKRLLEYSGWSASVMGGANDLGLDVMAFDPLGRRLVVQCKRYGEKPVGSKDMQAFLGTHRTIHGANVSAYVTTSRFTKAAVDLGLHAGVILIDRARLAAWMSDGPPAELRPWVPSAPAQHTLDPYLRPTPGPPPPPPPHAQGPPPPPPPPPQATYPTP